MLRSQIQIRKSNINISGNNNIPVVSETSSDTINVASRTVAEIIEAYKPKTVQHHKMVPIIDQDDIQKEAKLQKQLQKLKKLKQIKLQQQLLKPLQENGFYKLVLLLKKRQQTLI